MIYVRTIIFILLVFALHIGCTALTQVGWPPQPLVLIAILAVWLEKTTSNSRVILPAAFLVDLMQPVPFPFVTISVLFAWFVANFLQHRWLTNHSIASLFGLTILGVVMATAVYGLALWFTASIGISATKFSDAWSARALFKNLGIEIILVVLVGAILRRSAQFIHSRFLYASH